MKTAERIILRVAAFQCLAFVIYSVWTISSNFWRNDREFATLALWRIGLPSLIVIGLGCLVLRKSNRLHWAIGFLPIVYSIPVWIEAFMREHSWGFPAYYSWWEHNIFPRTDTFFILTLGMAVLFALLLAPVTSVGAEVCHTESSSNKSPPCGWHHVMARSWPNVTIRLALATAVSFSIAAFVSQRHSSRRYDYELWMARCSGYQMLDKVIYRFNRERPKVVIGVVHLLPEVSHAWTGWFPLPDEYFNGYKVSRAGDVSTMTLSRYGDHGGGRSSPDPNDPDVDIKRVEELCARLPTGCRNLPGNHSRLMVYYWPGGDDSGFETRLYDLRQLPPQVMELISFTDINSNWLMWLRADGLLPSVPTMSAK